MEQIIQIDLTVFRFVVSLVVFLLTFAGIFIAIGKMLSKLRSHCLKIKSIDNSLYNKGQPVYKTIANCDKTEKKLSVTIAELKEQADDQYDKIIEKLEKMDEKRDKAALLQTQQIDEIRLHMVKIDVWYEETHKEEL